MDNFEQCADWEMPPQSCSYLPEETQSLVYRVTDDMPTDRYQHMMERGWRRHGRHFFKPQCPACFKCRSLRVNVQTFKPTKSQRRIYRRNADIEWEVQQASVTDAHIDVFNRYHADMHQRRGWTAHQIDKYDYHEGFLSGGYEFSKEIVYFRNDRLIGVGLMDVVPPYASSVYFYHDPDLRSDGLGTYSLLCELEFARQIGLTYHYLGYWIKECQSMAYKSRFGPFELLEDYVTEDQSPTWTEP